MTSPSYLVSSIGTLFLLISNHALILFFSFHPLSTFTQSVTKPQAAPPSSFVSDVVGFPDPLLLWDCGFDPFCPFAEGSH